MKIKLLDKYIFSQVFVTAFACIFIFMIIWIMPETFLKIVQRTINGTYTIETAAKILAFELPKVLNIAIPVGILLGALFSFDKLSKDFEITVMRGSGFPFFRIISSVIILSIFACILTFIVGSFLLPYSACRINEIKNEIKNEGYTSQFVLPVKLENGAMDKILIVPSFNDKYIKDVIILNFYKHEQEKGSSLLSSIVISDYIKYNNESWVINSAKKYIISEEGIFKDIQNIENVEILSGESAVDSYKLMKYSVHRDRELTNKQISEYIYLLKKYKMDDEYRYMLNKYIQRYTHSLLCIIFGILGCILGFSKPREQKFVGMLIAVGVIFCYYITLPFFDLLAEKDILPPFIATIIIPALLIGLIIFLKKAKDL